MSKIYDNWERLVQATLRREQFREIALRTPSDLSSASSSSFNFDASSGRLSSFSVPEDGATATAHSVARTFTFQELAAATKKFRGKNLLGEGEFGRVYKGRLEKGKVVAVKQMDRLQRNREFLVQILTLSLLHHPNIVNLIGYCADGDHRLIVYEFVPLGSLKAHLHDLPRSKEPLDWNTRMKIAASTAKALEFLHDRAHPPVIHRDIKSSNILLNEDFQPKLSGFEFAKLGPADDKTHVSTRVLGTYGYCAPEYAMTGQLTVKCDIYSFGVVLLELISGRKAFDETRAEGELNIVRWVQPLFKDRRKFPQIADPLLEGRYPMRGLYQALAVAAMCLQEQAVSRPPIRDVVTALTYLASQTSDPNAASAENPGVGPSTPTSVSTPSSVGKLKRMFQFGPPKQAGDVRTLKSSSYE